MSIRHFLSLFDFNLIEHQSMIQLALDIKQHPERYHQVLSQQILGMVFEKPSTRTRLSFEVGMIQLGGQAIFLSPKDTQLGRGEPISDTAMVMSRMVDAVMIRTYEHSRLVEFAKHSLVPVINGLSNDLHPCQLMADLLTYESLRGPIKNKTVAWLGDGNNMCNTYLEAAQLFDFKIHLACPKGFEPNAYFLDKAKDHLKIFDNPHSAVKEADLITTDVWTSMGQEGTQKQAQQQTSFEGYQVNEAMLDLAKPDVIFLHCLPAHRGEEVSHHLLEDPRSHVWEQAENRLHIQKSLLVSLLNKG